MTHTPRPCRPSFRNDTSGMTGAERALLICIALAMVITAGSLVRGGSQQAADDAHRALTTRVGGSGGMGRVVGQLPRTGEIGTPKAPEGPSASPAPAPAAPTLTTGLGADIDKEGAKSPTLIANINALQADGWVIQYGTAGAGSYTDRNKKIIVIDSNEKGQTAAVLQTLAHESGHARYTPEAYVQPTGLTRDQYIDRNVMRSLKDEGEATITNIQIRDEILANKGVDIGIAGAGGKTYEALYKKYPDPKDREKLREAIGRAYATGEHPSTDPGKTYYDYYAKTYADFWDANIKGSKP